MQPHEQQRKDSPLGCSSGRMDLSSHKNKQKRETATPPSLFVSQGVHTDESASVVHQQHMKNRYNKHRVANKLKG